MQEEKKVNIRSLPPLFLIRMTFGLRNMLLKIASVMLPAGFIMMEKATAFWISKSIEVAASLGIAEKLSAGPQHVKQLAAACDCAPDALYRLLRALASEKIFREVSPGVFANNRLSETLNGQNGSVKYFVMHHLGDTNWELVGDMPAAVKTGENGFRRKYGTGPFQYLENHPDKNTLFNRAMRETSEMASSVMARAYPFGRFPVIADIGGGNGFFISLVLYSHRQCKGLLFDRPGVADTAGAILENAAVSDRCGVISGDFFTDVLPVADLYIFKNIFHDWDDEHASRILMNLGRTMPARSKLLIIDAVVEPGNKSSFGKLVDLQMLVGTDGGRERSAEEFRTLLSRNGFRLSAIRKNATPFSFIEAEKMQSL